MRKIPIGLELFSVRHELAADMPGTLKAVAAMGYEGVEFFGNFTFTADEIKAALEAAGLVVCGWHTPWDALSCENFDATVAYFKTIGNTRAIIPGLPGEMTDSIAAWLDTAAKFNAMAPKLAKEGIQLGYHNHASEFFLMDGQRPWDAFFGAVSTDIIMQLDNGNALSGGGDSIEILNMYPGRAKTVHLKPYSKEKEFATMIGQDDIDWQQFFALCQSTGNTEWYIVEYECEDLYTPMEGVKLCMEAICDMKGKGWL